MRGRARLRKFTTPIDGTEPIREILPAVDPARMIKASTGTPDCNKLRAETGAADNGNTNKAIIDSLDNTVFGLMSTSMTISSVRFGHEG